MSDAERLDELVAAVRELSPQAAAVQARLFFAGLEPETAARLADERPDQVGRLEGAPPRLRYRANQLRLVRDRDVLRARAKAGEASDHDRLRLRTLNRMLMPNVELGVGPDGRPARIERDRQFLYLDTHGDGKLAEVFGDLETARNVVTSVHGMGVNEDDLPAQVDITRAIHTEAGPDTATVLWIYDAPDGLAGAAIPAEAEEPSDDLVRYCAGLDVVIQPDAITTGLTHSFGTKVGVRAVQKGARFDAVVFAGSPGLGLDIHSVADLNTPDTRFFALRAPGDFVSYSQWHGDDPADFPDIVRLATAGGASVNWHEEYYRPNSESVRNVGKVCRGEYDAVTTTATTVGQETRTRLGVSWGPPVRAVTAPFAHAYAGLTRMTGARPPQRPTGPDAERRQGSGSHRPEGPAR